MQVPVVLHTIDTLTHGIIKPYSYMGDISLKISMKSMEVCSGPNPITMTPYLSKFILRNPMTKSNGPSYALFQALRFGPSFIDSIETPFANNSTYFSN